MTRKSNSTQAFIGPLRQGESRPVVQQGNQNGRRSRKRRVRVGRQAVARPSLTSSALAYTRTERNPGPRYMSVRSNGDVVVKHREYLADIAGSVAFGVSSFSLNPGLQSTFTWLAGVARRYESYLFEQLDVCYDTMKSASTNGRIMIAVDFDASDSSPANKQEFMANEGAVDSAVWREDLLFKCPVHDLRKFGVERYVRSGTVSGTDIKTYDVGNLLIATQGCADATVVGDIYLEYTILLRTPQQSVSGDAVAQSAKIVGNGSVTDTAVFGTAATITGGLPVTASSSTLTFQAIGQFIFESVVTGTGLAITPTVSGGTATASILSVLTDAAATSMMYSCTINVKNVGETFIFDCSAATTVSATVSRLGVYATSLA